MTMAIMSRPSSDVQRPGFNEYPNELLAGAVIPRVKGSPLAGGRRNMFEYAFIEKT